jgi:hypothetical protein
MELKTDRAIRKYENKQIRINSQKVNFSRVYKNKVTK